MAVLIQIQDAERKKIVRGQATQKQHATDAIMATHEVAVAQLKAKQNLELEAQWARQRRGRDAAISFQNAKDALIMEQAQRRDDAFLFPAATVTADTPHLHPRSASKALEKVCRALEIEGDSMHCFRRTFATRMGDMGVPGDVISRILNPRPARCHQPSLQSRAHDEPDARSAGAVGGAYPGTRRESGHCLGLVVTRRR